MEWARHECSTGSLGGRTTWIGLCFAACLLGGISAVTAPAGTPRAARLRSMVASGAGHFLQEDAHDPIGLLAKVFRCVQPVHLGDTTMLSGAPLLDGECQASLIAQSGTLTRIAAGAAHACYGDGVGNREAPYSRTLKGALPLVWVLARYEPRCKASAQAASKHRWRVSATSPVASSGQRSIIMWL